MIFRLCFAAKIKIYIYVAVPNCKYKILGGKMGGVGLGPRQVMCMGHQNLIQIEESSNTLIICLAQVSVNFSVKSIIISKLNFCKEILTVR